MENLDGDDVFKARRVVGQRDTNPPPEPVAIPPGDDLIETELGLRPRAEWEIILSARRAHHGVKELARTDYVVTKSMETGRKLSSEWTSWRQHLRDVVNGNGEDVRPEPDRWAVAEVEQVSPEPEHHFADLMLADETIDDARARLSQRLRELRHYLIAPEIKVNEDGSVGLTAGDQAELQDLERRQTLGRWLDA